MENKNFNLINLVLNERQVCDLELLLNGAFHPLQGFMTQKEYDSILSDMKLPNGAVWPIPIVLDISKSIKVYLNVLNMCKKLWLMTSRKN